MLIAWGRGRGYRFDSIIRGLAGIVRDLIKSFLPFHISEAANIAQVKAETILILVAHRTQREAAIFQTDTAAIPVVAGLHGAVLQETNVGIEAYCARATQPALIGRAVRQHDPILMKVQRTRNIIGHQNFTWNSQEYITSAKTYQTNVVIQNRGA